MAKESELSLAEMPEIPSWTDTQDFLEMGARGSRSFLVQRSADGHTIRFADVPMNLSTVSG